MIDRKKIGDDLMMAAINCGHTITEDQTTLSRDPKQPECSLTQLRERILAAHLVATQGLLDTISEHEAALAGVQSRMGGVLLEKAEAAPCKPVQQPAAVENYTIPGDGVFGGLTMKIDHSLPPDTIELQGANRVRMNVRTGEITTVPAAGVQGDFERKRAEFLAHLSATSAMVETWPDWKKNIWSDTKAATAQPDSGRDAALKVALDALDRSEPMYSRKFSQQERKTQHIAAIAQVRAALAAHPANGAQAEDAKLLEQAAQACDQQADGTNGPYRSGCLACASAIRELRDVAAPQKKEG